MIDGCIFCGALPLTKEDLFPKWMSEVISAPAAARPLAKRGQYLRRFESNGEITEQRWGSYKVLGLTARCVCENCNGGWMSDIEAVACSILTPMIHDRAVELGRDSQRAIATWLALKAIVFRYGSRPVFPAPPETLRYIHQNREAPPGWSGWIARYVGDHPTYYHGYLIDIAGRRVVAAILAAGRFAAGISGLTDDIPKLPSVFMPVWPAVERDVRWPPVEHLDDKALDLLSAHWHAPRPLVERAAI
jgi:hypothetical protein